jgi:hypothetical protein
MRLRSRPMMLRVLFVQVLALALLAAPADAKKPKPKPPSFKMSLTFSQERPWTYHYRQSGSCTLTDNSNGSDAVELFGNAKITVRAGQTPVAGYSLRGKHTRTGAGQHEASGADCEAPGTTNLPAGGCGRQKVKLVFATVELVGKKLRLHFESHELPKWECPFFDGADDASEASRLPSAVYRDVTAPISLKAINNRKKHSIATTGDSEQTRQESCATLVSGCDKDLEYNATASVKTTVDFILVRQ